MKLTMGSVELGRLRDHAVRAAPEECCGTLLGEPSEQGARVEEVVPAANVSSGDRRRAYFIAPRDLLAAGKRARALGMAIVGYYHSHPRGYPTPSERDLEHAWPGVSYLIVGRDGEEVRSWRLRDGIREFEEQAFELRRDR